MIIMLLVIGLFIVLGLVFINGKGSFLIAGFNTLPREEKEKYDEIALTKFMGKMMFALSFSMVFWAISEAYKIDWLFYVGLFLFIGISIFILVYTNTKNRFKK